MVVFLTGATGLAGAAIAEAASRRGHTVVGVAFQNEIVPPGLSQCLRLDLRDQDAVVHAVLDHFPEVIVNAAAVSEPARCDENPEESTRLNVQLPATLAKLANHLSARLIHLSTDGVFDGRGERYTPTSPTGPSSVYGRHKLQAEAEILARAPEFATLVRTTLLTGNSPGGRRSVHEKLFARWAAGETTPLFTDEIRQPCLADNLADAVVEISERNDLFGTFHWAGADELSRHEIGRQILKHFKLPEDWATAASLSDDANRPANLTLDCGELTRKLKTRPLPFSAQLDRLKVPVPFRDWYNSR